MLTIRPFTPTTADYQLASDIERSIWDEYADSPRTKKHEDETRDPKYLFQREMLEVGGQVIGVGTYGHLKWHFQPDLFFIDIMIRPAHQRRGFGTAYLAHVEQQLAPHNPTAYLAETRQNKPNGINFLEKHGFEQAMRYLVSELNVSQFDPAPFAEKLARTRQAGIDIFSVAELADRDPDWRRKLYELEVEVMKDVPTPTEITPRSFEDFMNTTLTSPKVTLDGWLVAVEQGNYIGLSSLLKSEFNPNWLFTGLTGVLATHRRRGVATALKIGAIEFAKAYGATVIEADNEENNPMYDLNVQLGYNPAPAWLDYKRVLT